MKAPATIAKDAYKIGVAAGWACNDVDAGAAVDLCCTTEDSAK